MGHARHKRRHEKWAAKKLKKLHKLMSIENSAAKKWAAVNSFMADIRGIEMYEHEEALLKPIKHFLETGEWDADL